MIFGKFLVVVAAIGKSGGGRCVEYVRIHFSEYSLHILIEFINLLFGVFDHFLEMNELVLQILQIIDESVFRVRQ